MLRLIAAGEYRAMHAQSGSNKLAEAAMHLLEKR
jgi:hypothetical protein